MKDEFSFIKKITPTIHKQPTLIMGIGDDAALYSSETQYDEMVCLDTMVEGVHFLKSTLKPFHIGYKAVAVNISDIAAMGGIPLFYLVSIAAPSSWSEQELLEIYQGMDDIASKYKIDLIGGDTVATNDKLIITVTVIGRVEKGVQLLRSHAKPGDVVFITNTVGNSAAGLALLLERTCHSSYTNREDSLVKAHQIPTPQVEIGRLIAKQQARVSLNDISDGVASEAHEIAEASEVKIVLTAEDLPIHESLKDYDTEQQLKWALYGGEDFQLIGTTSEETWLSLQAECKQMGYTISKVGTVTNGRGVWLRHGSTAQEIKKEGYNHFTNR